MLILYLVEPGSIFLLSDKGSKLKETLQEIDEISAYSIGNVK